MTNQSASPLFVTADQSLREDLVRLAAAAGVTPELASEPTVALRSWASAPLVFVGADLAPSLAELSPERRPGVHVVSLGRVADDLFRTALALGAQDIAELPRSETWVVESLTDLGEAGARRGTVIGVVAGSGGAGATTLACALGQMAARDGDAVVIDCDPLGAGIDRVLGLEAQDGYRWDALCQTTGRLSARSLREALPRRDSMGALSWYAGNPGQLQAFAAREALSAARRGHDVVVLDLPRPREALIDELLTRCDRVLVVVVPTVTGVASASRLCARISGVGSVGLVVRGVGLDPRDIGRVCGVPVVGEMTDQRGLAESIDLGLGPVRSHRGRLGRACAALLAAA